VKRKEQRSMTGAEMGIIFRCLDTSNHGDMRDMAMMTLMLDTGLRVSEACDLRLTNVDLEHGELTVRVKGGGTQRKWFSQTTAHYLGRWLSVRFQHAKHDCAEFFVSVGGLTPGAKMTRDGVKRNCGYISDRAGVRKFTPHDLRRSFTTISTLEGAPSRLVQLAAGWEDINMVELYTAHLSGKNITRYSPVEAVLNAKPNTKNNS